MLKIKKIEKDTATGRRRLLEANNLNHHSMKYEVACNTRFAIARDYYDGRRTRKDSKRVLNGIQDI